MKTAMQEFIEYLEKDYYINELTNFDKDKIQFLEKEKEQIVNDFENGYKACDLDEALEINKTMFSGERYYAQTYNQQ